MKATASLHSVHPMKDCPVLDGSASTQFKAAMRSANELSLAMLAFLQRKEPNERVAWLRTSVNASRALFQPWGPELLYTIAALGRARFNQLQDLLHLSSRTLSDKLKALREEGMLEREIIDEQPLRIEYFLTKHGKRTAAAATPLFTHLAHDALERSTGSARAATKTVA